MKVKAVRNSGLGRSIPPEEHYVIIYFAQKGRSEKEALAFYLCYSLKNWRNRHGQPINNWKAHAWWWIWNKT